MGNLSSSLGFFIDRFFSCLPLFNLNKVYRYMKVFSREWLFTTNHKKLGLNYLLFAALSGLFGTTLSTLMSLELAQPGSLVFNDNANAYHVVVGMHAMIMVFFLVTPLMFGGFGNYFLPIHVGASDVAYPRLNNFSLWILPAGLMTALSTLWEGMSVSSLNGCYDKNFGHLEWLQTVSAYKYYYVFDIWKKLSFKESNFFDEAGTYPSLKVEGVEDVIFGGGNLPGNYEALSDLLPVVNIVGNPTNTMAGWTFTTPFSHSSFTGAPVDWAMAALMMSTLSSMLTLVNLMMTWSYLSGSGSSYQKEFYPMVLISMFMSMSILVLVSPILNAGLIMLMADSHFYTSFFTVSAGGDLLLFQHLFWFFGHPEVYVLMMPAFGMTSTIMPYYVSKPLGSKMHMVYAMHAMASMGFVVWGHHMYLVGIDNKASVLFFVITVLMALPASMKVCGWMASLLNSTTYLTVELLFAVSFMGLFIMGGLSGSFCAHTGTDMILHDTYYMVGHFHVMLSGALMGMLFTYVYFNFSEFLGMHYVWSLSFLHLVFHVVGHMVTFMPMLWLGYSGMPRSIQDYPWGYAGWHSMASLGHTIVLVGVISFIFCVSLSIYMKSPVASSNGGFPFVSTSMAYLALSSYYLTISSNSVQVFGLAEVSAFMNLSNELAFL